MLIVFLLVLDGSTQYEGKSKSFANKFRKIYLKHLKTNFNCYFFKYLSSKSMHFSRRCFQRCNPPLKDSGGCD